MQEAVECERFDQPTEVFASVAVEIVAQGSRGHLFHETRGRDTGSGRIAYSLQARRDEGRPGGEDKIGVGVRQHGHGWISLLGFGARMGKAAPPVGRHGLRGRIG